MKFAQLVARPRSTTSDCSEDWTSVPKEKGRECAAQLRGRWTDEVIPQVVAGVAKNKEADDCA